MTEALPIDPEVAKRLNSKKGKDLYGYQGEAIDQIMARFRKFPPDTTCCTSFQPGWQDGDFLGTRQALHLGNRQARAHPDAPHRALGQTSSMLTEIGVPNKIINSKVKELEESEEHWCYVAMVETLNNRLNDERIGFEDLGLVVVDEAHYNSFRKLFKHFDQQVLLGVTATPLSSNIKLPSTTITRS